MKILVLGSGGQVGSEVMAASWPSGVAAEGLAHANLDISDRDAVQSAITGACPDLVVNAAAYTAVDRAETDSEAAFAINRDGAASVAEACARNAAALIHLSTDYVFDGTVRTPYREDVPMAPLSVYGQSKAEGESAVRHHLDRHVIVRTAWVYGLVGRNFVKTMLSLAETRSELRVVADQQGSPTSASEIADVISVIAGRCAIGPIPWGTYHFAGAGVTTWHGFAEAIFELAAPFGVRAPTIIPIATADYPTAARRPAYSVLDCAKLSSAFGVTPRPWRAALAEMLARHLPARSRRELK
jgi:dTDP-4-dehydrorhamnose reductase